jgi:CheY-like chemotaxis protein
MPAPSKSAGLAASSNWNATAFGDCATWPPTLRLSMDIMLGAPWPMLLVWGPKQIVAFNQAYAALAGPQHPPAPGGMVPSLAPPPMVAAGDAHRLACGGTAQHLHKQRMTLAHRGGAHTIACDLHLTPLRDEQGEVAGVLYAIAPDTAPQGAEAPAGSGLRVLVVEDNLDSQYLVCEMLKAFGHDADGVGHAEDALHRLAGGAYDVLFSDVSLPGMSGVDLARQALREAPAMQVIFASGYGEALLKHVEFPFQSLQKPYEIEQLQAALAAIPGTARKADGQPSV